MPAPKVAALSEWLSKADAAALLGISPRQIERREAQGYLTKRLATRRMGESTARAEYSRADLEALKAGTPNVHAREVATAPETGNERARNGQETGNGAGKALARVAPSFDQAMAAYIARVRGDAALFGPPAPRPWLTLAEAAEYSGLPAAYLVAAARKGTFRAINVGRGAREFWRFNREGLGK